MTRKVKNDYVVKNNAVCITVYHPQGDSIPAEIRESCLDAIQEIVDSNRLLINVATT